MIKENSKQMKTINQSLQIVPIQGTTKNSQVETERGSSIDSSSDELHGLIVYTHGCIDFFHSWVNV